jgi:hypothetical protein
MTITTRYTGDSHRQLPTPLRAVARWVVDSPPALRIAAGLSLLVHAAAGSVLLFSTHRVGQLADAPIDGEMQTVVTLAPIDTPAPQPETKPEPAPQPEPEPKPEATPEAKQEPVPAPTPPTPPPSSEPTISPASDTPPAPASAPSTPTPSTTAPRTTFVPKPPADAPAPSKEIAFAGLKAKRASRVVYVVDASGPMVSHWAWAGTQLRTSLARLDQTQQFQVLVTRLLPAASGQSATSRTPEVIAFTDADGDSLHAARPTTIASAVVWLGNQRIRGAPDPLPGLARALALKPDLILLLSHSFEQGLSANVGRTKDAVLAELDRLNPRQSDGRRAVVIKTVQLGGDDPTGLLQAIALEHGDGPGSYHAVTPAELGDSPK